MSRNDRTAERRQFSIDDMQVGTANSARQNAQQNLSGSRTIRFPGRQFERLAGLGQLHNAHGDSLEASGKKALQKAVALTRKHDLKTEASMFETMGGRVADVIVREARKWKADLIVMGTHGRRGIGRVVLGSDAEAVLREARVPVLLLRAPDPKKRPPRK